MVKDNNNRLKLGIIDSLFPNIKTGFRIAEFNWYLKHLPDAKIFSYCSSFQESLEQYIHYFPWNASRIKYFGDFSTTKQELLNFDLYYTVFLSTAYGCLTYFNHLKKPFAFTLYPGSSFLLDVDSSDQRIHAIISSPYFKKVIVTQKVTYDYLLTKHAVSEDKIELIYGVVNNPPQYTLNKRFYKKDKDTFDICFSANKYMPKGLDKGYDLFIEVCNSLQRVDDTIMFHVMGGFNEHDLDISKLKGRIKFYGSKTPDFFPEFYSHMDIILSPTRPFTLLKGAFDGFPTTCCVDAAFNGCLVFASDPLHSNLYLEDGVNIVLINENTEETVTKVLYYKNNLDILYRASLNGQEKFKELFHLETQMQKRLDVLNSVL